jgi:hypothetical protein
MQMIPFYVKFDEEEDKARNVKLLLYMFEQMAGLKINFEKVKSDGEW